MASVNWLDMHRLSQRILLKEMKAGGLLRGDVDDMMKAHLCGAVFMPCMYVCLLSGIRHTRCWGLSTGVLGTKKGRGLTINTGFEESSFTLNPILTRKLRGWIG